MECWHITLSTEERRNAFPDRAARLAAVRALVRILGPRLMLWCVVDDHVHLVCAGTRPEAGRLAQRVNLALAASSPHASFFPAHIRKVENRKHLTTLVAYVLRQSHHHSLGTHPARWDGSCLYDLAGARMLPGYQPTLQRALPRLRRGDLADAVGISAQCLEPRINLGGTSPDQLVAAGAAAVGAPTLGGRARHEVAARAAVLQLARQTGWPTAVMARALDIGDGSARRLAAAAPRPDLHEAIRRQVTLRASVAEHATREQVPA